MNNVTSSLSAYLDGSRLYGDSFNSAQIETWYKDEEEGYSNLIRNKEQTYNYSYRELDKMYFFDFIKQRTDKVDICGLGSAFAHEFIPVLDNAKSITVIEPSNFFHQDSLNGFPITYKKPTLTGKLDFENEVFDVITCFSVLHHIPNVTYILKELLRCLKQGGILFIREPVVSMREPIFSIADFSSPKAGLSRRERGIPIQFFERFIQNSNLELKRKITMGIPINKIFWFAFKNKSVYNSKTGVMIDRILSSLLFWNVKYHSYNKYNRIRPSMVLLVLEKK